MKTIKILHVISSFDKKTGGPAAELQELIPALVKLNLSSEVACSSISGTRILKNPRIPVHEFFSIDPWYRISPGLFFWGLKHLNHFDLVVIHGLWQFPTLCFLLWRLFFWVINSPFPKVYIKPHGMLDPWFQKSPSRKIKALRNYIFWGALERHSINHSDGLLFGSKKEMLLAKRTFPGYKPKSEKVVGTYVNPAPPKKRIQNSFCTKFLSTKKYSPYFLCLSRIDPKKGLDLLIPAYAFLQKRYLKLPILVMAGPGWDTPYGKKISNLARRLLKNGSYRLLGPLYGLAKWSAFYNCLLFILPSRQENFGIAVAEALSCNRPVLISNQVNICDKIQKGRAGLICSPSIRSIRKALFLFEKQTKTFKRHECRNYFGNRPLNTFKKYFQTEELPRIYLDL